VYLNNPEMLLFLLTLFGLAVSSFIAAFTYRIVRNINFVKGRSFCDFCGKSLPWYHNIPLFSYVFLKGKSACCGKKISPRYFLIELVGGIGTPLVYYFSGNVLLVILFLLLLTIFVIDFENQIIPDELSFLVFLISVLNEFSFEKLFSAFLFAFTLLLVHLLTKGKGMGLGDVKLTLGLAFWLGLYGGLVWLAASFLTGGIVASILLLSWNAKLKTKVAFGPFLIFGFLASVFFLK